MSNNMEWKSDYSPADINAIRTVERNFGINFPHDYLEVALEYHGGEPSSKTVIINNKAVQFGYLLTFLAFDELDILDVYNTEKKHLPNKHVPFAIDNEGNMFCFDFDNVSSSPSIVFVEKGGEASANFVAKNFKDFIYLLK